MARGGSDLSSSTSASRRDASAPARVTTGTATPLTAARAPRPPLPRPPALRLPLKEKEALTKDVGSESARELVQRIVEARAEEQALFDVPELACRPLVSRSAAYCQPPLASRATTAGLTSPSPIVLAASRISACLNGQKVIGAEPSRQAR